MNIRMNALPNLAWLRSFEAASRLGSFTAAGADLGLTQAAVSGHIGALEAQLGHALFNRSTRKIVLTESGRAYLPSVRKALQDLARSTEDLFGRKTSGHVTVRAPISAAVLILSPALPRFNAENPELSIRLLSAIWADTVLGDGIDIEIRLGRGAWPDGTSEALGPDFVVPACHPDLANAIRTPQDLAAQTRIHILGFDDHWPRLFGAMGLEAPEKGGAVTVDTSLAAVEWAAAQGGVALILERAARNLVAAGRLVTPLDVKIPLGQTHHFVRREKHQPRALPVIKVENWLRTLLGEQDV